MRLKLKVEGAVEGQKIISMFRLAGPYDTRDARTANSAIDYTLLDLG
jgi:hypothetical protein